jgi:hypothetical protein
MYGDGIVRGVDGEINLNEAVKKLEDFPLTMVFGFYLSAFDTLSSTVS